MPPIAFRIPGGTTYTWLSTPDGIHAIEGDADGETLVELTEVTFSQYLHELLTASGSVRTDRATLSRGSLASWKRWEPATRTLITGKPIYTEAVSKARAPRGAITKIESNVHVVVAMLLMVSRPTGIQ